MISSNCYSPICLSHRQLSTKSLGLRPVPVIASPARDPVIGVPRDRRFWCQTGATANEQGPGTGGGNGSSGRPRRYGSGGPEPGPGSWCPTWLKTLVLAAGGFVVVGLLEPWTLLTQQASIDTSQQTVAIIIPVLNESATIISTLQQLHQLEPPVHEIIVVDGGSTDNTVKLVKRSGLSTSVLHGPKGRASQMNTGAEAATADLLCFLHADTLPPKDLVYIMRRELSNPRVVLGGFAPSIEVSGRKLHVVSFHNWVKTYYTPILLRPVSFLKGIRVLFGDQAMFCRALDFKTVGGFDTTLSIMEDADLCIRMHEAGPTKLTTPALSSTISSKPATDIQTCTTLSPALRLGQEALDGHTSRQQQVQEPAAGTAPAGPQGGSPHAQSRQPALTEVLKRGIQQPIQRLLQPRGRIKQVLDRKAVTSGRRIAALGSWKATYVHVVISLNWYFGKDPQQLRKLYDELYTDAFR